jgi:SAM-dependent methyltransferase
MANPNNIEGHRARLEFLKKRLPPEKVGFAYVGGGDRIDPALVGFMEEEAIRRHRPLTGAYVIDLGCGVGRLTKYLLSAGIDRYLGTDILPEILAEARALAAGRPEFSFALAKDCVIPERDGAADIVCAFSLITHLLDEEVFLYFREAARVLKPKGVAVFSFLDFAHPTHQKRLAEYIAAYKAQRDLLKFFERDTLCRFAEMVGMTVVEIIDGGTAFPASGQRVAMTNGAPAASSVVNGQSLLFLERR